MNNALKNWVFLLCCFFFLFTLSCSDGEAPITKTPPEEEIPEEPIDPGVDEPAKPARIISFIIESDKNDIYKKVVGSIYENTSKITLSTQWWIGNIEELVITFQADGSVKVENTEQVSGVTKNDFSKELKYTVTGEDKSEKTYTVTLISPQTSGLPVIKVDTDGGAGIISKEAYLDGDIKILYTDNKKYEIDTRTQIRGRGNSTWGYPKKPYRLKFFEKTSLFGYPAEKSWVLLANYQDPTLIMNTVAFELGNRFGLPYTNHSNHVELFINGSYDGSYMLTEQVQVQKNRVNVNERTGFLVELDTYFDTPQFRTDFLRMYVTIKSPEEGDYTFVKDEINALEAAMFSSDFPNTNYKDLIDINTFIDHMMVNDIIRNTELQHPKSMFMYKKDQNPDSKICMGPLWDFDWGFGYAGGYTYYTVTKDMLLRPNYNGNETGYKFFSRFFDDPDFRTRYKARWNEHYEKGRMDMNSFIDVIASSLEKSQAENFKVWPNGLSYSDQISKMKHWLEQRIEYMNTEINKY
jgi:hypothetical protein